MVCLTEVGFICSGTGTNSCSEICGDGKVVGKENCDSGSLAGCKGGCKSGPLDFYVCSGGNVSSASICSRCGDDVLYPLLEECDDYNNFNGDGCSATCKVEIGYRCVIDGNNKTSCTTICGDNILKGSEVCDDGS